MAQMPPAYHRERRHRLIAAGRCRNCLARPADSGYTSCLTCREKGREREARRRESGTGHYDYSVWRARRFARVYGITLEEYETLLTEQEGVCALCGGEANGRGRLAVDHDHETGRVRGLLCFTCNTTLGRIEALGLDRLASYLERSPA